MLTENELSYKIIGAAIELHRQIGPGLLESAYENALVHDLRELGLDVQQQLSMIYDQIHSFHLPQTRPLLQTKPILVNKPIRS